MLNERLEKAINMQINRELYSAYLYLSMAAYFDSVKLPGFSSWMKVQYQEETSHAMKFFEYMTQEGARIIMLPIEEPPIEWRSPLSAFEEVFKHEQKVTGMINNLLDTASSAQDEKTKEFLRWFIKEQKEEEESASVVINMIRQYGEKPEELGNVDAELKKRKFTAQIFTQV